jgi:tetratricopeptide (TPR) repeat protein
MSGDPKRARAELGRLSALQRPHPLTGALRKLLDRIDKGETPPLKVDDLPSLSSPGDAGAAGDGIPGSTSLALRQALEARTKGDSRRAENLYQSVIDKDPNNSEALSGLASLARSQGANGRAMGLFQRVVDHNPNYVPAIMSLADMKWDSGDRGAASALYARAIELGGNEPRAKERSGGGAAPPPVDTTTSSSTGTAPTAEPGGSTSGGAPTPPVPDETPKEGSP